MADVYQNLASVLVKEAKKQKELLETLTEERAAIATVKLAEIEKINRYKEALINQAREIEAERSELIRSLKMRPKQGHQHVRLDDIIEICPNENAKKALQSAQNQLKEYVLAVFKMNEENASLIYDTLGVVVSTVAIMLSSHDESVPTYAKSGAMKKEKKATVLNSTLRASV